MCNVSYVRLRRGNIEKKTMLYQHGQGDTNMNELFCKDCLEKGIVNELNWIGKWSLKCDECGQEYEYVNGVLFKKGEKMA